MATYSIRNGDTFETIARNVYGTETQADLIREGNPGLQEPLTAGVEIIIPTQPGAPKDAPQDALDSNPNEVAVKIEGTRFRFWDKIKIIRAIDAMDVIELGAPFESEAPEYREFFRPFSFNDIEVTVGGSPFFTGTMVSVDPPVEPTKKTISIGGYSLPGVLNDCTAPASAYPIEYNDTFLQDIAVPIVRPFGLEVVFEADQGAVFERVAMKPGQKILMFLAELAKQRNLIISNTAEGAVLFQQSEDDGTAVVDLEQGEPPLVSVLPFFNPQDYYSHITGLEPVLVGLEGSQFTVQNSRLAGVLRPFTFETSDTIEGDVKAAVEAKAGRMFANAVSYSIRVPTWRDPQGDLWEPNTFVNLTAPDAMVYERYKFVIRSITFERDRNTEHATLNLVIPGSFSGRIPERLPWD